MSVATHYAVVGEGTHQVATGSGILHAIIGSAGSAEATLFDSGTGSEEDGILSNPEFPGSSQRLDIEVAFDHGLYWVQEAGGAFTILWSE